MDRRSDAGRAWSLSRYQECVLRVVSWVVCQGRRLILTVSQAATERHQLKRRRKRAFWALA